MTATITTINCSRYIRLTGYRELGLVLPGYLESLGRGEEAPTAMTHET